jgi:CHASE2 domain-containing sensor protein
MSMLRRPFARLVPQPAVGTALAGGGVLAVGLAWLHPEARHIPLPTGVLAILLAGAVVAAYYYPIRLVAE